MRRRIDLTAILLALGVLCAWSAMPFPAHADSWAMPEEVAYESSSKAFRLIVKPRKIGSQLRYFQQKVAESEGKVPPEQARAAGVLQRKRPDGKWDVVWSGPLANEVAPVSALVSEDGKRAVTFDDWHHVGRGPNAIVIYDEVGGVIVRYALTDLVPLEYAKALPSSVSSTRWAGERRIDEQSGRLIVEFVVPSLGDRAETDFVSFEIELANGKVIPPHGPAWEAALKAATGVSAASAYAEVARTKYLREPLSAPTGFAESAWHQYLGEAFYRLTPNWLEMPSASTTVLRDPSAHDYKVSEKWVIEALSDEVGLGGDAAFASPSSPENLVTVLQKGVRRLPAGSLSKATIYVAVPLSYRDRVAEILAPSGAKFVWIDPASTIPQRPERIPGSKQQVEADRKRAEIQAKEIDAMLGEVGSAEPQKK